MTRWSWIADRLVSGYELELLDELKGGSQSAYALGVNVGPNGWSALRAMASLEARGLVRRDESAPDGFLAWELTDVALGALR